MIREGSLTQIQQRRAAVKAAATIKRAETDTARYIAGLATVERDVVGRSIRLVRGRVKTPTANFAVPVKRNKEYRSPTGQRTFHMGWSSVTKSTVLQSKPGTRVYADAASRHVVYIEDEAMVRQGHTVYIDSSRVEKRADGERLVFSNISEHYDERVEFFELVDKFERVNHGDKVDIDFSINTLEWTRAVIDLHCDLAVVEAYEAYMRGPNSSNGKIALIGSSSDLQEVMARTGFNITKRTANKLQLKRDGVKFHNGRGGRTEYRLVFELPREFNREQRAEAMERLCQRFADAGCMYVAVIHAPDPHNDQSNFHAHLDFYDRPCRRFDKSLEVFRHVKPQFLSKIVKERKYEYFKKAIRTRAWDFTVVRTYQSNKKEKTHRPFGAVHKSEALRDKGFVKKVREGFAEDINAVARQAQMDELYDPRNYAAMGINAPVTDKLGPRRHAMETKGIPTKIGMSNEAAQTEFQTRMIEKAYEEQCLHINEIQYRWQAVSEQTPPELNPAKHKVDAELAKALEAAEIRRDLDHLALEQERERSRARLVSERQGRALKTGSPATQLRSAQLARSADDYIAILDERDSDLATTISELEIFTAAHGAEQAERAVLKFGLELRFLQYDRHNQPASNESLAPARRNIMVKRGTFEQIDSDPQKTVELPSERTPAPARRNIMVKRGTSKGFDSFVENPVELPEVLPATAAIPHTPLQAEADPERPSQAASTSPGKTDTSSLDTSDASYPPTDNLPNPEKLMAADRIDATPATDDLQKPSMRSPSALVGIAEDTGVSLLVENLPQPATSVVQVDPAQNPTSNVSFIPNDKAVVSADRDSQNFDRHKEVSSTAERLQQEVSDGADIPSGTPINAKSTDQVIEQPVQPGFEGPNTNLESIVEPKHDEPKPTQSSAAAEKMDATTALKLIWLYGDLNGNRLRPRRQEDNDLYASALAHTQADELRNALAHHISIRMAAAGTQPLAVTQKNEPSVFAKEANELASYEDDPASNDAIAGVVKAVVEREGEGGSRHQVAGDAIVTYRAVAARPADNTEGNAAAELVKDQASPNHDGHPESPVGSGEHDQLFPSVQNGEAKAEPTAAVSPAAVAAALPPVNEHDLLIHRFETARSDVERRMSAVAIRADKIALARMTERENPHWAAIDEQFRTQQRIVAMTGGGISY